MSELEIYKGMVKKMKDDEIKEKLKLIDGFFNKAWACDLDEVYHAVIDTITNLQQENERLNYQLEVQKELTVRNRLRKHCYKSRIEKAVEYLKNNCYIGNCINTYEAIDITNVMNILNGRSDE